MTAAPIEPPTNSALDLQSSLLLEAVATAASEQECKSALTLALVAFDPITAPTNTCLYDAAWSGIVLLVRCLQRHVQGTTCPDESGALTVLYLRLMFFSFHCSDDKAVSAVYRVGTDLVSLVVSIYGERIENPEVITSLLQLVDRLAVLKLEIPLIERKELMIRLAQRAVRDDSWGCRPLSAVVVKLLGGWCSHPNSKRFVMNVPGLVEDVLAAAVLKKPKPAPILDDSDEDDPLPIEIARFLRQLAWDGQMKSDLVQQRGFFQAIHCMIANNDKSSRRVKVSRATIEALGQMCTEAMCRLAVCNYEKGSIVRSLLTIDEGELTNAVNHTLLRLIGQDTAPILLKKHSSIIERLTQSAQIDMDLALGNEASIISAQALKRLSSYVSVQDRSHPNLLDSLTLLAKAKHWRIRLWAVKGLNEQAKSSSGRFYMARTSNALSTLIQLAKGDPCESVKTLATGTLLTLASDSANAKRLVNSSDVLETFAKAAQLGSVSHISARSAVQAILFMTCHKSTNKQRLAKTLGLVESLTRYGVSQDADNELKRAALHCVVILAPLM